MHRSSSIYDCAPLDQLSMTRANITWQSSYLDQDNEFVTDRAPYPYIQMNPQDMDKLRLKQGDLVEIYNDNGSTRPWSTRRRQRSQSRRSWSSPKQMACEGTSSHPA